MPSLSLLAIASVFLGGAFAAPVQLDSRAISASLLSELELFEQFAAAAYCPINNNSTGTKLVCSSGNCPRVQAANTYTVLEFENSLITDVTGYVATDSTNDLIVVAFRGSESLRNWVADLSFGLSDTDICDGCEAETGFYTSWLEARSPVIAAVESAAASYPTYSINVVGHSLGGAIADLCAAQLRNDGYTVGLYTYGSPRLGPAAISEYISNQTGGNYRVTHKADPIPRLPPIALGYVHISPEYYISSANYVTVTAADITEYTGDINYSGNTGDLVLDAAAHGWYFNNISSCYPDTAALEF